MRKIHISILLLALVLHTDFLRAAVPEGVWSMPEPQGLEFTTFTDDGTHYILYNPVAKMFFASGNGWNTMTSLRTFGMEVWLESATEEDAPEGSYLLCDLNVNNPERTTGNGNIFTDDYNQSWVDHGTQANYSWSFEIVGDCVRFQNVTFIANNPMYTGMYLGWDGTFVTVNNTANNGDHRNAYTAILKHVSPNAAGVSVDFKAVTVESYEAFVASKDYATYTNGVECYFLAQKLRDVLVEADEIGASVADQLAVFNNTSSTQSQLNNAITDAKAAITERKLELAGSDYENATVENPVDMTAKLTNPDFTNNDLSTGWSTPFNAYNGVENAEYWNMSYNTHQDIDGLPEGVYALGVKAFYRAGSYGSSAIENWLAHNTSSKHARLYATVGENKCETAIANVFSGAQTVATGYGGEVSVTYTDSDSGKEVTVYVPNDMSCAEYYMHQLSLYDNKLLFSVGSGETVTIGVKKDVYITDDWSIFDDFTLTYYGDGEDAHALYNEQQDIIPPVVTISTDGLTITMTADTEGATIYYTLDGSTPSQSSIIYSFPFEIDHTCTIKAIAVVDDQKISEVASLQVIVPNEGVISVGLWTMPEPQGLEFTTFTNDGTRYYLYNPAAKLFFASGNSWETQASLRTFGYPFWVEPSMESNAPENTYELWDEFYNADRPDKYGSYNCFTDDSGSTWTDRESQSNFSWTYTIMGDYVRFQNVTFIANNPGYEGTYIGWAGDYDGANNSSVLKMINSNIEGTSVDWKAMTEESYLKFVESEAYTIYVDGVERFFLARGLRRVLDEADEIGASVEEQLSVFNNTASTKYELSNAIAITRTAIAKRKWELSGGSFDNASANNPVVATVLINNPNFDDASYYGWSGTIPNMFGSGSHGPANVAEKWNETFDTYQDIEGLPVGVYALGAQTMWRGSWYDMQNGIGPAAKLYAKVGDTESSVSFNYAYAPMNTESMAGETPWGVSAGEQSYTDEETGNTYYIPNDPSCFRLYAEKGLYDTKVLFYVTEGNVRIGVKNLELMGDADNWSCFDTFTLTYYGDGEDAHKLYNEQQGKVAPVVTITRDGNIVTITADMKEATIYFTLDGGIPTEKSILYTGSFVLEKNCTVKAIAVKEDMSSDVVTYIVNTFKVENVDILYVDSKVQMSTTTPDASIYYTLDGSTPTENSLLYTEPFSMDANNTVKAIAIKDGYADSEIATYVVDWFKVEEVNVSVVNSTVILTTETDGATIYYTIDGSEPTTESTIYSDTNPIAVDGNCIIKAIAVMDGNANSEVITYVVDWFNVELSIRRNGKQIVIDVSPEDAVVYYTTDGSTPTTASTPYKGPFELNEKTTVKAIGYKDNYNTSDVTEYQYEPNQVEDIVITFDGNTMTMACATEGAAIYYAIYYSADKEQADPTANSSRYSGSVTLTKNCTVKAVATAEGYYNSSVTTKTVDWFKTSTPVFAFNYETGVLTVTCATEGATISYSIDGGETKTYTEPVSLAGNVTVKSTAVAPDFNKSEEARFTPVPGGTFDVATATYTITGETTNDELLFVRKHIGGVKHLDLTDAAVAGGSLGDETFSGMERLVTLRSPKNVGSVGARLFANCPQLSAVVWNAEADLTATAMQGTDNPNLLLYVSQAGIGRNSGVRNRIVNGTADEVVLSDAADGGNFHCPESFTARRISYSHVYRQTTGIGGECRGWETIALPFDVQTVTHRVKGEVTPFMSTKDTPHFWLYELGASGFTPSTGIRANSAYIIAMPHHSEYAAKYDLGADSITFEAENAVVPVTQPLTATNGAKTFVPCFTAQPAQEDIFVLNVGDGRDESGNDDATEQVDGYAAGSVFLPGQRAVRPFEAYTTMMQAGVRFISIFDDGATGMDMLFSVRGATGIHDLQGRKVTDKSTLDRRHSLRSGVYIMNGKKKIIK